MPGSPSRKGSRSPRSAHDLTAYDLSRIIRLPKSIIQFAAFDPATATGDTINGQAPRKLTRNEELCRAKRIVIETTEDGCSSWRFVPNARREQGVTDEGVWPRVLNVCGELRTLTQDQWDFYKLDPAFECLVRLPPNYTTVTRCAVPPSSSSTPEPASVETSPVKEYPVEGGPAQSRTLRYKRPLSAGSAARRLSGSNSQGQRKKARRLGYGLFSSFESENEGEDDDEADEEEVGVMVVDKEPGRPPKRRPISARLQKVRANKEEARKKRKEAHAKRQVNLGLESEGGEDNDDNMSWAEIPIEIPSLRPQSGGSPSPKRGVECFSEDEELAIESSDDEKPRFRTYERVGSSKRTRAVHPDVARRAVEKKRKKREAKRKQELDKRLKARSQAIHERFMKEILEDAARAQANASTMDMAVDEDPFSASSLPGYSSQGTQSDEHSNQETQYAGYSNQGPQYSEYFQQEPQQFEHVNQDAQYAQHFNQDAQYAQPFSQETQYTEQMNQETHYAEQLNQETQYAEQFNQEMQYGQASSSSQEHIVDEEARRLAAIEESKRKIAELERDKLFWNEQARVRAAQEAEERAREATARREKREAAIAREREREAERRRAAEEEQRAREAAAAEVRKKRERARDMALREDRAWLRHKWTSRRALERYLALSDVFDAMNFAKDDVIVFESVPWPVLTRPGEFGVEDIDWTAVESFFNTVRAHLSDNEYMQLVEKSHRRFHPDRWRSRRVLQSVEDEEEKECLEDAANIVAQALTPIWQETTGR